jgi:hypothetical protein
VHADEVYWRDGELEEVHSATECTSRLATPLRSVTAIGKPRSASRAAD